MYCHSAALGCQCNSRSAPGSISSTTPVMVVEIGNCEPSARHSLPPSNTSRGLCDSSEYLCDSGGSFQPCSGGAGVSGGILPLAKYTSDFGKLAKAETGRPKFFASNRGGACPSQSVMLKVPNSEK